LQASGSLAAGRANHAGQDLSKLPNGGSQVLQVGGWGKGLKTVSPLKKKKKNSLSNHQIMLAGHNQFNTPANTRLFTDSQHANDGIRKN